MNKRLCLKIARRVDTLLIEQLGEGVQAQRMLDDPLYARDVLLVCEAMSDPELPKLARMFQQALVEAESAGPSREPLRIAGLLNSIFASPSDSSHPPEPELEPATSAAPRPRRWFNWGDRSGRSGSSAK